MARGQCWVGTYDGVVMGNASPLCYHSSEQVGLMHGSRRGQRLTVLHTNASNPSPGCQRSDLYVGASPPLHCGEHTLVALAMVAVGLPLLQRRHERVGFAFRRQRCQTQPHMRCSSTPARGVNTGQRKRRTVNDIAVANCCRGPHSPPTDSGDSIAPLIVPGPNATHTRHGLGLTTHVGMPKGVRTTSQRHG